MNDKLCTLSPCIYSYKSSIDELANRQTYQGQGHPDRRISRYAPQPLLSEKINNSSNIQYCYFQC